MYVCMYVHLYAYYIYIYISSYTYVHMRYHIHIYKLIYIRTHEIPERVAKNIVSEKKGRRRAINRIINTLQYKTATLTTELLVL